MTLKDLMADDMAVLINTDEFAQDVTYTPDGGTGRTISVVFNQASDVPVFSENGEDDRKSGTIFASTDATTGVGSSPSTDDTFTIGGNTWHVTAISDIDDDAVTLEVVRIIPVSRHRSGYRTHNE